MTTTTYRERKAHVTDLRLMAAVLGLLFIANPLVNSISLGVGDMIAGGAALYALLPIATRVYRQPRIAAWLLVLVVAYLVGVLYTAQVDQGLRHVLSTSTVASAILLFSTYGREMISFAWFRAWAYFLVLGGLVAINFAPLHKNLMGGTMLYLGALLVTLLIVGRPKTLWFYSLSFVVASATLAFVMDFRSLIAFTVVVLLGYWGATTFPKRTFWLGGIVGASAVVGAITWYFLSLHTNSFAIGLTQKISEVSGRRANSGRDVLWSSITFNTHDHQWFGLGVGMLPKDFLVTDLSSHSTFMQTFLQLGFFGVALVVLVLLAVWKPLAMSETSSGKFGAAIFLMFVVHNSMEVLMFQNGLIASMPAWCAIGLALALANNEADEESHGAAGEDPSHQVHRVDRHVSRRVRRAVAVDVGLQKRRRR